MCNIFCCFGCVTLCGCRDLITRKLVFFPPTPPSYAVETEATPVGRQVTWLVVDGLRIAPWSGDDFSVEFVTTSRKTTIPCMWIGYPGSTTTIVYSHGNAADIGFIRDGLLDLAQQIHTNIICYDYSGYGLSTGKPSQANVFADVSAVYQHLLTRHPDRCRRIIAYGQSLGSGPSLHLGTRAPISGAVLHSGLLSAVRVIRTDVAKTPFYDVFTNIDKVRVLLRAPPVFVIHGQRDTEIPVSHGAGLSNAAVNRYPPWFPVAGHNDIEACERFTYMLKMREFVEHVERTQPELDAELCLKAIRGGRAGREARRRWAASSAAGAATSVPL